MSTNRKHEKPASSAPLYPSLRKARASAKRLAKDAEACGHVPLTEAEFDREMSEAAAWPDREFAEFQSWLRAARATGQYSR